MTTSANLIGTIVQRLYIKIPSQIRHLGAPVTELSTK